MQLLRSSCRFILNQSELSFIIIETALQSNWSILAPDPQDGKKINSYHEAFTGASSQTATEQDLQDKSAILVESDNHYRTDAKRL